MVSMVAGRANRTINANALQDRRPLLAPLQQTRTLMHQHHQAVAVTTMIAIQQSARRNRNVRHVPLPLQPFMPRLSHPLTTTILTMGTLTLATAATVALHRFHWLPQQRAVAVAT
jgi:hypothetical protein